MNEGRVLQIGTPAELFDTPEHTFVGYFIGSPGMNLMPAEVDGRTASVERRAVPLAAAYPAMRGGGVQLGIRPEFATLAAAGCGLPVRVRRVEDLGRRRLARVELEGLPLVATMPPGMSVAGDEAGLRLDPAHLHVFEDGRRVQAIAA
jgi:glycerol transport system ATP-binding protein